MGRLKDGWGDGKIDLDGVQTGGEEAENSLGTFRLRSGEFQRGNWACVFTLCLSMWEAHILCECACVCSHVWVDTVCVIRFMVHRSLEKITRKTQT